MTVVTQVVILTRDKPGTPRATIRPDPAMHLYASMLRTLCACVWVFACAGVCVRMHVRVGVHGGRRRAGASHWAWGYPLTIHVWTRTRQALITKPSRAAGRRTDVVTLKGRAACEIDTADELLASELLLNGTFSGLDSHAVRAWAGGSGRAWWAGAT